MHSDTSVELGSHYNLWNTPRIIIPEVCQDIPQVFPLMSQNMDAATYMYPDMPYSQCNTFLPEDIIGRTVKHGTVSIDNAVDSTTVYQKDDNMNTSSTQVNVGDADDGITEGYEDCEEDDEDDHHNVMIDNISHSLVYFTYVCKNINKQYPKQHDTIV